MYTSQTTTPIPVQNISYIYPQTQQTIPVQPQLTQPIILTPQVPQTMSMIIPQPQPSPMTQEQMAISYAKFIPPTPTCSGNASLKIYQFYKYVDVAKPQPIQQDQQNRISTVPVVNNGNYIIQ